MQIPYYFLLYFYYSALAIWALFGLIGLYHLLGFNFKTKGTYMLSLLYVIGSVALILIQFNLINQVDWQNVFRLEIANQILPE